MMGYYTAYLAGLGQRLPVWVRWAVGGMAVAAIVVLAWLVFGQTDYAAQVNGETITKAALDQQVAHRQQFYSAKHQDLQNYPSLRQDVLQNLIDQKLVEQYAAQHAIVVSDQQVAKRYQQIIANKKEDEFLQQIESLYHLTKSEYVANVRLDLLKEAIQQQVGQPYAQWIEQRRQSSRITIAGQ
jgi:hypothetical protein